MHGCGVWEAPLGREQNEVLWGKQGLGLFYKQDEIGKESPCLAIQEKNKRENEARLRSLECLHWKPRCIFKWEYYGAQFIFQENVLELSGQSTKNCSGDEAKGGEHLLGNMEGNE